MLTDEEYLQEALFCRDLSQRSESRSLNHLECAHRSAKPHQEKEKAQKLSQKMTSVGAPGSVDNKQDRGALNPKPYTLTSYRLCLGSCMWLWISEIRDPILLVMLEV